MNEDKGLTGIRDRENVDLFYGRVFKQMAVKQG